MIYILATKIHDDDYGTHVGWEFTGLTSVRSLAIRHVIRAADMHVAFPFPNDVNIIENVTTEHQPIINDATLEELNDTQLTTLSAEWDESDKSHMQRFITTRLEKEARRKAEEQRVATQIEQDRRTTLLFDLYTNMGLLDPSALHRIKITVDEQVAIQKATTDI